MRIVMVNFSDLVGGAARAAFRLHNALLTENIDSKFIVQQKISDQASVLGPETKINKTMSYVLPYIDKITLLRYPKKMPFYSPARFGSKEIIDRINSLKPDIVHLHWIYKGMIKFSDIRKIRAPIVWSFHDMWAFTGGCHYDMFCNGYKKQCGHCKVLGSNRFRDFSNINFKHKAAIYNSLPKITFVCLSKWLMNCASESTLLKGHNIINLPNPIDTSVFKPIDKLTARYILNFPNDKKLILFGAMNPTSSYLKGFHLLFESLSKLKTKNIELVIFGANKPSNPPDFNINYRYVGQLSDDISLSALYSAVDVSVIPSIQENLSNTIMESLACGTPVVSFNIGGNSDMVEHLRNGFG